MQRTFREDFANPDTFAITVELVLAAESRGKNIDTALSIAKGALEDGRVSAVSITDNPGGNPSLSPDILGREILDMGLDVLVHMTCRDLNRAALESRALQLARLGIRNVLALTGDYTASGFGGQGSPVFDLDSVTLLALLRSINHRLQEEEGVAPFLIGCGVSPFKATEPELFNQYQKLRLKVKAGAEFVITQLGYDARKFQEVLQMERLLGLERPTLASLYHLMQGAAKVMHNGSLPGAVVTKPWLDRIVAESQDKEKSRANAVERSAKLGAVVKGLGYKGLHVGGVSKSFDVIAMILDRMAEIEDRWEEFLPDYDLPQDNGFYMFRKQDGGTLSTDELTGKSARCGYFEQSQLQAMRLAHHFFFRHNTPLSPAYHKIAEVLDQSASGRAVAKGVERPVKQLLFGCAGCGDCALQHTGYVCPESQCPKHTRNGPCGGSHDGRCESRPDRKCVWVRAYERLASISHTDELLREVTPPRMWTCNDVASWLNFHMHRDHQSIPDEVRDLFKDEEHDAAEANAAEPPEDAAT